jgi:hypothetical protein
MWTIRALAAWRFIRLPGPDLPMAGSHGAGACAGGSSRELRKRVPWPWLGMPLGEMPDPGPAPGRAGWPAQAAPAPGRRRGGECEKSGIMAQTQNDPR